MNQLELEPQPASPTAGSAAQAFAWQLLGLLANVSALTALLIYFGWRRAETQAAQMGFDESLLGMSTQDYLLRSIGPALPLLLTVAGAGLVWLWADRRIAGSIARQRPGSRHWPWLVTVLGLALPAAVYLTARWWEETAFVAWPLSIGAAVLLAAYGEALRMRRAGEPAPVALKLFAGLAVGVFLFWSASNRAEVLGWQLADTYAQGVSSAVRVTVYAGERLYLQGPGVAEEELSAEHSAYRFRYTGLRLLDHIGERYFLVPDGWTPTRGAVITLTENDSLRFEYSSND